MNCKLKDFKEALGYITQKYWGDNYVIVFNSEDELKILIMKK